MKWYIYFTVLCLSAFQFFYWGIQSDSSIIISCSAIALLALLLIGFGMLLNRRLPIPPNAIIIPYFLFYLLYTIFCIDFTVKWKLVVWSFGTILFLCLFVSYLYDRFKRKRRS